ncbi:phosphatase PAP2 family protein [Tumebacillus sp. DT12]|uniref:Phosphatase PAP2 family protein n=1 Tax=Tumebacillus lacus TaxID=2995335 RepID=A0ABT3X455_9BACL|nr:phosphatase PAP2 family protein [Tumebacillus lacus]MCX7571674.1 phosphatase PAP2 family protein [Tumebacillus lacus]
MTMKKWLWPLLILATALVLYGIVQVQNWGVGCVVLILLTLIGVKHDQTDIPWKKFLPIGFLALFFPFAMYNWAGPFWSMVTAWQTESLQHYFKWNEWFASIPYNDAEWLRFYTPEWLVRGIGWIYWYGFTLSFWACMIRAFFTKDAKKMLHYALAGFVLQTPLILPFYNTILLEEVWYVYGQPDMLSPWYRTLGADAPSWVLNCFPSMHTSMAFAMLLMARRENSRYFRRLMGTYCSLIIFSTMYLKIHWVIDVMAGMLFAYGVVKLADGIMHLLGRPARRKLQQQQKEAAL